MFTFGPSPIAVPPPSFKVLLALETTDKSRIILCAPVCLPSSQTGVTWDIAMGVTFGPSPLATYLTIILEKVVFERESHIMGLINML